MRSLEPYILQNGKLFSDIAAAKQPPRGARLLALKKTAAKAYADYKAKVPEVQTVKALTLTAEQKADLHHAFETETAPLTKARGKLLGRERGAYCPFCDLNDADTLDHYLPKEVHPIFSVFGLNLVPCCPTCNTRKRTLILDENTHVRAFFHPYFDDVPTQPFLVLTAKLKPKDLILQYSVQRAAGMTLAQFQRLSSHFEKLGLAEKYRRRALTDLRDYHDPLHAWFQEGGAAKVSAELQKQADLKAARGPNNWQVVLFQTLASHQAFCDQGFNVLKAVQ